MDNEDFLNEEAGEVGSECLNFSYASLIEIDAFRNQIKHNIESRKRKLIIDLSLCENGDSYFIDALIVCPKKTLLYSSNFNVVIREGSYNSSLIQATALDSTLNIYLTKEEYLLKHFLNQNSSNN